MRWDTGTCTFVCMLGIVGGKREEHCTRVPAEERGRQSGDGDDVQVQLIRGVSQCEARE